MIRNPTTRDYLSISIYWLAISFFWGAVLTVVVQERVQNFVNIEYSLSHPGYVAPPRSAREKDYTPAQKTAQKEITANVAAQMGSLLGVGALVSMLTQIVFGAISDNWRSRFGRRKPFLIAGTLLASLGVFAFAFAQNYAQLFAVFLWIQFFLNVACGPYSALLPDLISTEFYGKASAFMGFFTLVGRTGGMIAASLVLQHYAKTGLLFLTVAFLVLLNGLMMTTALLTRETPTDAANNDTSSTRSVAQNIAGLFRVDLRGQSSFVWVLVSRFAINTGVYMIMPFLLYYLMSCYGLSEEIALGKFAVIGLVVNLSGLLATFPAGTLSDRTSKKNVIYVTCVLCIVGGLGFVFSGTIGFAIGAAGVFGLGYGAFTAVDWALVCNVLPDGEPAKYMGLWSCSDTIPQIVAPSLASAVIAFTLNQHYAPSVAYRALMFAAIFWFGAGTFFIRFVRERATKNAEIANGRAAEAS